MKEFQYFKINRKSFCATFILTLFLFGVNLNVYAQEKLSISFDKVPLKTAMANIEKQTGYKFVYTEGLLDVNQLITAKFTDVTIDKLLQDLLETRGVSYTLKNKTIELAKLQDRVNQSGKVTITGTVYDENGDPFPFINIFDPDNPKVGVFTDDKGKYNISVAQTTKRLSYSFMGYKTAVVNIGKSAVINQTMELEAKRLDEVVFVGFGEQSKASISASVSSIQSQDIIKSPVANVTNAIAGRVAGITTMQSSGQPGLDNARIIVRGQGSWNSVEPLYVIDGVERTREMFATMDANEIETFSVLKDAAATAVYGSKGANGVILITSKRGQSGTVSVSFNASTTFQQFTRYPNYLGSYESLQLYNEALMNDGFNPLFTNEELEHYRLQDDPYRYPDTDWYKLMMRKVAPQYNASLNIRGGSKSVRYFIAGSALSQEGQFKTSQGRVYNPKFSSDRYRFSANMDAIITNDFTISIELSGTYQDRKEPSSQLEVLKYMNRMAPWYMPAYNPDGSYAGTAEFKDMNPLWLLNTTGSDQRNSNWVTSSVKLKYDFNKLVKGLVADVRIAFDSGFYPSKYWYETQSTFQLISRPGRADRYTSYLLPKFFTGSASNWANAERRLDGLANIVYSKRVNDHSLRVQGIANFNERRSWAAIPYNTASFIGRVNYSYKNRYHLEANASYRGSENFAPGRRFGLFPSVSASWNVSEEKFMKNIPFINSFKLRTSYGMTGSDYVNTRFIFKESKWTTETGNGPVFGYASGSNAGRTIEPTIANPLATWEKAEQVNFGTDISVWNNRLSVSYDWFFEKRRDVLQAPQSTPSILGIGLPSMNIGKTQRSGWELELSYNQDISKTIGYYIKGNVSYNTNKIVFCDEPESMDWWRMEQGKPIGQYFGYLVEGFFQNQQEIDNAPRQEVGTKPIPGDLRYTDYNGDGVVNTYDRVPIGYTQYPRYTFGLSFGFNLKNFDFNVLFQGAAQSSVFISQFLMYEFYNRGKVQEIHLGRWNAENAENATYPALHIGSTSQNHVGNSFFIKNNPYLRLKNVEIAYTLGSATAKKIGMKGLRVYLSAVNLLTWDKLKVVDPETPTGSTSDVYPQARNFSVGVNFNF